MSQFLKKPRYLASNLNAQALLESISKVVVTSTYPTNKSPDTLVIGTHDGSFHCDEALAISLLQLHPTYAHKVHIVRTRKPDILDQCDVVVDVGATYDPSKHRYDHHQREFVNTFTGYHTKLSSAGIIYQQFGKEILSNLLIDLIPNLQTTNQSLISIFYQKIYAGFIEHIDAIDNGVAVSDGEIKYHVSTTLSSRVGHLNPEWNEPQTPEIMNERFIEAMMLTCSEFIERVSNLATIWWPARSIVQEAIENRFNIDTSGKIIVFKQFCPWKDHLFELEQEVSYFHSVFFLVIINFVFVFVFF